MATHKHDSHRDYRVLDAARVVDSYVKNNVPITPLNMSEEVFLASLSLQLGYSGAQYSSDIRAKIMQAGGSTSDWHYWYCKWVLWEHEHGT